MNNENNILLKVSNITKSYTEKKFWKKSVKNVLNDVSFSLKKGKCLGIIGESGSGKSTLGRILTGIENADSGFVEFEGKNIHKKENKEIKNDISIVFQNYVSSVNPKFSIAEIISEPLIIETTMKKNEINEELKNLIKDVGLSEEFLERFPNELSGGQLQRVVIARALTLSPEVLIYDEATAALDVSVQQDVLKLMYDLRKSCDNSVIFICHDLAAVRLVADRIIVMYNGKIVEIVESRNLVSESKEEYTKKLIGSVFEVK